MKKRFTFLSLLLLLLAIDNVNAQIIPSWDWAKSGGNASAAEPSVMCKDKNSGQMYMAGSFSEDSIRFGDTVLHHIDPGFGQTNSFLVKYDSLGNLTWAKNLGLGISLFGMTTDHNGNLYATGMFGPEFITIGTTNLNNEMWTQGSDFLLVKYDASGNFVWAKDASGFALANGRAISVDGSGNIYITGEYYRNMSLGSVSLTFPPSDIFGFFVAKYNSAGVCQWATKGATGEDPVHGTSIATDANGNSYITGEFMIPSLTFGSDVLTGSTLSGNMFVAKYNSSGTALWGFSPETNRDVESMRIAIDDAGSNFYLTGVFRGDSVKFGNHKLINSSTSGFADIFLTKYDTSRTSLWAVSGGGLANDYSNAISVVDSRVYIAGNFESSSLTIAGTTLTNQGERDLYVAQFNSNSGSPVWALSTIGSDWTDEVAGIAADADGHAYIVGAYRSDSISFGATTLRNPDNMGYFVAKLSEGLSTGIENLDSENKLHAYPNPFNDKLNIDFTLPEANRVKLEVFNVAGQILAVLYDGEVKANENHHLEFTPSNISRGIIFYRLQTETETLYNKVLMVK